VATVAAMLALPPKDWYSQHPRPMKGVNLDIALLKTGLRIEDAEFDKWRSRLVQCLAQGGLDYAQGNISFQRQEHRDLAYKIFDAFIA